MRGVGERTRCFIATCCAVCVPCARGSSATRMVDVPPRGSLPITRESSAMPSRRTNTVVATTRSNGVWAPSHAASCTRTAIERGAPGVAIWRTKWPPPPLPSLEVSLPSPPLAPPAAAAPRTARRSDAPAAAPPPPPPPLPVPWAWPADVALALVVEKRMALGAAVSFASPLPSRSTDATAAPVPPPVSSVVSSPPPPSKTPERPAAMRRVAEAREGN